MQIISFIHLEYTGINLFSVEEQKIYVSLISVEPIKATHFQREKQHHLSHNEAFRHVETLFVQGNIFVLNQNKPPCLLIKKEVKYC